MCILKVAILFLYLRLRSINEHTSTHVREVGLHYSYHYKWKYLAVDDYVRSTCWELLVERKVLSCYDANPSKSFVTK
jgi:hypothetical protein